MQKRGDLEFKLAKHDEALRSYEAAVESFNRALGFAPAHVYAHNNKGIVLHRRGVMRNQIGQTGEACRDWKAALAQFSRTLKIAPKHTQAHKLREVVENLINEHYRKKQV